MGFFNREYLLWLLFPADSTRPWYCTCSRCTWLFGSPNRQTSKNNVSTYIASSLSVNKLMWVSNKLGWCSCSAMFVRFGGRGWRWHFFRTWSSDEEFFRFLFITELCTVSSVAPTSLLMDHLRIIHHLQHGHLSITKITLPLPALPVEVHNPSIPHH